MLGGQTLWFDTFCLASAGEVHVPGLRVGPDCPGGRLRGLSEQLSEHFWWDLGNCGEHSSGPVGMQHGAPGGRPVRVAPPPSLPLGARGALLRTPAPCAQCTGLTVAFGLSCLWNTPMKCWWTMEKIGIHGEHCGPLFWEGWSRIWYILIWTLIARWKEVCRNKMLPQCLWVCDVDKALVKDKGCPNTLSYKRKCKPCSNSFLHCCFYQSREWHR